MKDLGVVLVAGGVALVGAVAFQYTHPTEDPGETDDEVWSCASLVLLREDDEDSEQVPSPDEVEDLADPDSSEDCQPA